MNLTLKYEFNGIGMTPEEIWITQTFGFYSEVCIESHAEAYELYGMTPGKDEILHMDCMATIKLYVWDEITKTAVYRNLKSFTNLTTELLL